jgi:hypothetical protein
VRLSNGRAYFENEGFGMSRGRLSRVSVGICVGMIFCCAELTAQTNTFPSSGNVGIGTTSPSTPLDVQGPIGEDDNYDHSELGQNGWGGSHTIAFGAYQGGSAAGQSDVTGWFQNFQSAGPYSYGPALMEYVANGGEWNFLIGPASPGAGQNVVWGTPVLTLRRGGNVGIGTMTPAQNLKQLNSSGVLVPYTTTGPVLEVSGTIALSTGQGGGILFPDGTIQSTAFGPSNCSTEGPKLGPTTAPSGSCSTNGAWAFSQDGHATFCASGTWTTKI